MGSQHPRIILHLPVYFLLFIGGTLFLTSSPTFAQSGETEAPSLESFFSTNASEDSTQPSEASPISEANRRKAPGEKANQADTSYIKATAKSRNQLFEELAAEVAVLERQGNLLKKVVRLTKPSIVHIEAAPAAGFSSNLNRLSEEAGSGVIISLNNKTYVLTNRHVVKNASPASTKIKLSDGRTIHPTKIWTHQDTDVAIAAVSAAKLIPAHLGDSNKLEIGDFVLAVGSPFGLNHSVTYGIISAKGRRDLKLGNDGAELQDFLQTDAAINPGNSGGPLLNLRGEVIGINTAIASSSGGNEGIGFSIPINMVMVVAKQLLENGNVMRAYLGVKLDADFNFEEAARLGLSRPQGARVTVIQPNTPAEHAQVKVGDVILQYNGNRIEDDGHLINLVGLTPVGKEIDMVLYRNRKTITLKVKVENRPNFESVE